MIPAKVLIPSPIKHNEQIIASLFLLFVLAQVAFVWWLPWLPTQDGPCHIYNLAILKDLRNGGGVWGQWFEQHLTVTPNLGFHLVAYPLLSLLSPESAERAFITIYIVLFSVSIPLSLKLLKLRYFPWSFLVVPIIWSYSLAMGFYSFIIALPILIISMALTIRLRASGLFTRFIIITAASAILFVCHIIPFACFALFILISLLVEKGGSWGNRFLAGIMLLTPSAGALGWHLAVSDSKRIEAPGFLERFPTLATDILTCSTFFLSPIQAVSGSAIAILLYTLIRERPVSDYTDYVSKLFGSYAVAITLLTLLAPPSLGGGGFLNPRLPTILLMTLIPLFAAGHDRYPVRLKSAVIPVVITMLACNCAAFLKMSSLVGEFMAAARLPMKAGTVVMPYRVYGVPGSRVDVLAHAISHYALRERLINAGNYQMQFSYFPVRYRPELYAMMPSLNQMVHAKETIDFDQFTSIGYIFAWDAKLSPYRLGNFRQVYTDKRLCIWERCSTVTSHQQTP